MHFDMLDLPRDITPEKRRLLVDHIVDLFVAGADNYQNEEIAFFNSVLENMLSTMEDDQKQAVSERLAPIPKVSQVFAFSLAKEEIAIAEPMLTKSQSLEEKNILFLSRKMGQEHLVAISKRMDLNSRITDALLERGKQAVQRTLADNDNADLSDWGMRMLVKFAAEDNILQDRMIERADITDQHYDALIALFPKQQQTRIQEMREKNDALVKELFRKASQAVVASQPQRKLKRKAAKDYLIEIRNHQVSLNTVVKQLSLSNDLFDIGYLLSEMSELDQKYVLNALVTLAPTATAIVCKALGLDLASYRALSKTRATHTGLPHTRQSIIGLATTFTSLRTMRENYS